MSTTRIRNDWMPTFSFDETLLAQKLEVFGITQVLLYNDSLGVPVAVLEQSHDYWQESTQRLEKHLSPTRALRSAKALQEVFGQAVVVVQLEPHAVQLTFDDTNFLGFSALKGTLGAALEELALDWGVAL